LAGLVKEEQINFIALSETGRESFPDHVLKIYVLDVIFFGTLWLPMVDQVGSCLGCVKPQIFKENPNPCTIAIVPGSVAIRTERLTDKYTKSYIASHKSKST
jgi:hypothetical protein